VLRPQVKIVFLTLVLTTAAVCRAADPSGAAVSGVVRDAQGIAQMGALVQVVADDSALVGTAFTDLHGRYLILHLLPGKYEVRASAALFVPALRGNLQLRSGAQAVVNLTLNTLFETAAWLPAERRKADEPSDDWKWTLRSAANRPILRWDENGDVMSISSSATESSKASTRARAAVTGGDGGLGNNGVHNVFSLDRVLDDGAGVTLRADVGTSATGPSTDVATGYERRIGFGGAARTVVSYQAHPEMIGSGGSAGLEAMHLASAEKIQLGDMVDLQAGGTVYIVRTSGYASSSQPFLKVTVRPTTEWTVGYRMATSQNLQSYEGLDAVQQPLPVAVMYNGRLQTERGLHQEFALGRKFGPGLAQVAYYRDALDRVAISGGGPLPSTDLQQRCLANPGSVIADSTTGEFRLLSGGYKTQGLNVTISEPLSSSMWVAVAYSTGAALKVRDSAAMTLADAGNDLTPETSHSATVSLKGSVVRSGTRLRAAYRWQPSRLVTAVDPYAAFGDQAYMSFYLRQAIRFGRLLPPGLDATVDITNLLAQGYRPFLSADGQTLFLAQSPRTMQAGLAFTF
jgi:Carboxypeptidase regulatory-like domain